MSNLFTNNPTNRHAANFDAEIRNITERRGSEYGHPADDFRRASLIKEAVEDCPHPLIRHALEMIGVKLARLTTTPDHIDSVVDIAGYARTIVMILDKEETDERKRKITETRPRPEQAPADKVADAYEETSVGAERPGRGIYGRDKEV